MNPRPRFGGRFLFILIWLFFISLPIFAFVLAARQEIRIGSLDRSHLRIFLLQERNAEGIGVELELPSTEDPSCKQSSVRYFMWAGNGENVTFCRCPNPQNNEHLQTIRGVCNSP